MKKNDGENALISIKTFCVMVGYPIILQTDNGSEFKNENINNNFCVEKNIKHIFSPPIILELMDGLRWNIRRTENK